MSSAKNHYCAITTSGRDIMNVELVSTIPAVNYRLSSERSRSFYIKCGLFITSECIKYGKMDFGLGQTNYYVQVSHC
jgi:hypothetical protein